MTAAPHFRLPLAPQPPPSLVWAWVAMGSKGAVRRHRDGRWYVDFGHDRRVWSLHKGSQRIPLDQALAHRVLEAIRSQAAEVGLDEALAPYLPAHAPQHQIPYKLAQWLDTKRREVEAGDRSPTYYRELRRYARPGGELSWWDGHSIYSVTWGSLQDWSHWLADRGLGPKTRRNVLAAFRAFLGWLYQRGELREIPRRFPWPKGPERAPRVLTIEAQAAVLEAIPEPERGIFLALALMGLRPGEARALDALDYRDGWLTVDKAVKGLGPDSPVRGTKTGRAKRLPVPAELSAWLDSYRPLGTRMQGGRLFLNPVTRRPWSHWALRERWVAAVRQVGLPPVRLYEGTKHTFATDAAARGVPERALQAFLGHEDARSTRRYAVLADRALVAVLGRGRGAERKAGRKKP